MCAAAYAINIHEECRDTTPHIYHTMAASAPAIRKQGSPFRHRDGRILIFDRITPMIIDPSLEDSPYAPMAICVESLTRKIVHIPADEMPEVDAEAEKRKEGRVIESGLRDIKQAVQEQNQEADQAFLRYIQEDIQSMEDSVAFMLNEEIPHKQKKILDRREELERVSARMRERSLNMYTYLSG